MAFVADHRAADGAPAGVGRRRVLVIDDEPLMGSALARLLAGDCDVVATTSAREALDGLLRGQRYESILCDVCMPEMSGVDFHEELARRMPAQARRMIFMTGGVKDAAAAERLDSLPNTVLLKPIELGVLRWALAECRQASEDEAGSMPLEQ